MATPKLPPRWLRSSGNAVFGLIRDPRYPNRMAPCIRLTDDRGRPLVIQLSAEEIRDLHADADKLMDADAEQVATWWKWLAAGSDGRSRLPVARLSPPEATEGSAARTAAATTS
jgi:hypothetical protein